MMRAADGRRIRSRDGTYSNNGGNEVCFGHFPHKFVVNDQKHKLWTLFRFCNTTGSCTLSQLGITLDVINLLRRNCLIERSIQTVKNEPFL